MRIALAVLRRADSARYGDASSWQFTAKGNGGQNDALILACDREIDLDMPFGFADAPL